MLVHVLLMFCATKSTGGHPSRSAAEHPQLSADVPCPVTLTIDYRTMTSRIFLHGRACGFNDRVAYLFAMFFTTAPTTRVGRRAVRSHSAHFNIIKKCWVSE